MAVVLDRRIMVFGSIAFGVARALADEISKEFAVYQLRIYEIFEHNKAAFHIRFRDHAMRIMREHGFQVMATWEAHGTSGPEFVYLLRWSSEHEMNDRWKNFMADQEWSRIKQETAQRYGQLVGRIESRIMNATDYSPQFNTGFAVDLQHGRR